MSHILRQTLAFYREHAPKDQVRLHTLMQEVLTIFEGRIENRSIRLKIDIPEDLAFIGSPGEIRQVLCNLVANAIDAVAHNGLIVVKGRAVGRRTAGAAIQLTVADTGCGIPREDRARIFEPFFTSKRGVGTGLGLWVSKQLVERNCGTIRVRSRVGTGTAFSLRFPTAPCGA
ncbi:HAMP domain-containing histidine kinase [Acidobacteria bacterium AB60]|nr:HAMP domain-containing histidine kinase [Acidobacteria bacterium AB60]